MKKEWMYFIAGIVLVGAIVLAQGDRYSDFDECVVKEAQKYQAEPSYSLIGTYCKRYPNV
jgi:hypothetical protein